LGAEVLRHILTPLGYRVETIYFDANFVYHIDSLMPLIREGLLAVNENVLLTDLPDENADCEQVNIDPDEYVVGAGSSVPLSPSTHAVTEGAKGYISELEKRGVVRASGFEYLR